MKTIRIGVIGIGIIGKQHIERYSKIAGAEVVAIADVNESELERVGEQYGIPNRYVDFRKLLERDDIDAVDVCLHNNFHMPVTVAAMQAGKHVYSEKPIAGSYADGKMMLDAAQQYDRKLHIQLMTLYYKETKAAKTLIDDGRLGRLYHARSTGFRRRGRPYVDGYATPGFVKKEISAGGALIDMGIYHISQLLFLLDNPQVERISGKIYQEVGMDRQRQEQSGFDVEELGLGFVKLSDGVTLDIIESWAMHLNSIEGSTIVGSQGGIRLSPFSFHTTISDMEMDATVNLDAVDNRWHRLRENEDAMDSSEHHWIAALQGRVPLLPTADIALQTMLISEGIYMSDRLGREVSAEEVFSESQSTAVKLD
ncbi:Gfo/Idh/MocA family protein [Paenibacillus agaridevorans]|uniref:Gfo/Idh/MocA family protein n=1 Tax=Paenibacillus agaridevorans TaxID=171404 RepID=UPI001BE491DF|nr:Gfo/Idh/MocA family oxidoreductase [Paenibacillus agaridevorans]